MTSSRKQFNWLFNTMFNHSFVFITLNRVINFFSGENRIKPELNVKIKPVIVNAVADPRS